MIINRTLTTRETASTATATMRMIFVVERVEEEEEDDDDDDEEEEEEEEEDVGSQSSCAVSLPKYKHPSSELSPHINTESLSVMVLSHTILAATTLLAWSVCV